MREINEIRNRLSLRGLVFGDVDKFGFWMIVKMQMMVDIPTWLGSYEKAWDSFSEPTSKADLEKMEKRAIQIADQDVIDTQGGGHIKDMARIQRGGAFQKIWTSFLFFFNTTFNQTAERVGKTNFKSASSSGQLAAELILLFMVPVIYEMLIKDALRGDLKDKSPEEIAKKFVGKQLSYMAAPIPFVRELGGALQGFKGYSGPAGAGIINDLSRLMNQTMQGDFDEGLMRATSNVVGDLTGLPMTQAEKTLRGIIAFSQEEASAAAIFLGPPPKSKKNRSKLIRR